MGNRTWTERSNGSASASSGSRDNRWHFPQPARSIRALIDSAVTGTTLLVGVTMIALSDTKSAQTTTRQRHVACAAGLHRNTVQRAIRQLVALGYIRRIPLEPGEGCHYQWLAPIAQPAARSTAAPTHRRSPSLGDVSASRTPQKNPSLPTGALPHAPMQRCPDEAAPESVRRSATLVANDAQRGAA